jgi:hypothetical protein
VTAEDYVEIKRMLDGLEALNKAMTRMLAQMWIRLDDMRKRDGVPYDGGEDGCRL